MPKNILKEAEKVRHEKAKKLAKKTKRGSKYDEPIHIDAHPRDVIRSLFTGKPKPKAQWKFVQEDKKQRG